MATSQALGAPSSQRSSFAVVPVVRAAADRADVDLRPEVAYFFACSGGRCQLSPFVFDAVVVPDRPEPGLTQYADRGGLGRYPRNTQALALRVVTELLAREKDVADDAVLRGLESLLLVVFDDGYGAHTWHPRGQALPLGRGRYCRTYAVVPAEASSTVRCHELGHLLFDWPDLARVPGLRETCLMGEPSPSSGVVPWPSAPLRLAQGWAEVEPALRTTTVGDLAPNRVFHARTRTGDVWVERASGDEVVVYRTLEVPTGAPIGRVDPGGSSLPLPPYLRVPSAELDRARPLLAVLAEWCSRG